jgi:hypothetical protein
MTRAYNDIREGIKTAGTINIDQVEERKYFSCTEKCIN